MNVKNTLFDFIIIKNVLRMFETTFHNYRFIGGGSNSLISCLKQKVTDMHTSFYDFSIEFWSCFDSAVLFYILSPNNFCLYLFNAPINDTLVNKILFHHLPLQIICKQSTMLSI